MTDASQPRRPACPGAAGWRADAGDCSVPGGDGRRYWQEAGIAALISLAQATAPTVIIPAIPAAGAAGIHPPGERDAAGGRPGPGIARRLAGLVSADQMIRNSLYLVLSAGLQAVLGFGFWIATVRLFSASDVGRGSSLISAAVTVSYLALLGLNSAFVRYLPTARDPDELITAGLMAVVLSGSVAGLAYVLLIPVIAPRLDAVVHHPLMALGFVLLTSVGAVNVLTDSVFIAARKTAYNALVDGGIGGLAKLGFVVLLAGTGSYGLFCASASAYVAAAVASVILIFAVLAHRPSLHRPLQALRPVFQFSGASYAGSVGNLLPTLVVPLIVLDRLGAPAAGYYFVAFQVANLLYSASFAVEQTFLAEGSQAGADLRDILRRSIRVLAGLCLPASLALVAVAHWLLLIFGPGYSRHGTPPLILLAAAALPLAVNNWLQSLLRLLGNLRAVVLSNAAYAVAICGLAWMLAPHGLTAVAASWPAGTALGAMAAAVPCTRALRRRSNRYVPRPRRAAPGRPGARGPSWSRAAPGRPGARGPSWSRPADRAEWPATGAGILSRINLRGPPADPLPRRPWRSHAYDDGKTFEW
jgi:O-antigen/teichoic acid export membrane protein